MSIWLFFSSAFLFICSLIFFFFTLAFSRILCSHPFISPGHFAVLVQSSPLTAFLDAPPCFFLRPLPLHLFLITTHGLFFSSCTYHIPLVEPTGIRIAHSTYIIIHPHHTSHAAPNSSSLFAIISYPHMRFSLLFSQSLRRKQIYVFEYFIGIFAPFSSVSSISRRLANPSCSCSILSHLSIQPIR